MICVVARQFPGPDGMLAVGTRVDTSIWRPMNTESLLRNRFLTPVALVEEPAVMVKVKTKPLSQVKKTKRVFQDEDDE